MTSKSTVSAKDAHHRILSISFKGGFLDGAVLEFQDGLNCVIGGRGSGKTTVLETIRYVLDQAIDERGSERAKELVKLVESNLQGGSAVVTFITDQGMRYTVSRSSGERPIVTDASGKSVDVNLRRGLLFGADIYSQNHIEEIARDTQFQLRLIDRFVDSEVADLNRRVDATHKELEANAVGIIGVRKEIDDLIEGIRDLPDLREQVRAFEQTATPESERFRKEGDQVVLRAAEARLTKELGEKYDQTLNELKLAGDRFRAAVHVYGASDLSASVNKDLIEQVRAANEAAAKTLEKNLRTAIEDLESSHRSLDQIDAKIAERHRDQDQAYRDMFAKEQAEKARGAERVKLEKRMAELRAKEQQLVEKRAILGERTKDRDQLRTRLSELCDARFNLRTRVAKNLSDALMPMIRVSVQPFGDMTAYREKLTQALKGSGMKYAAIVDRAVERVPPAELAALVQAENGAELEAQLELDKERATRLIIQLKDKAELFAIETVELHDKPLIELQEGDRYKDASHLSTGQKCTTVLPILMMESKRPLLIDQPEDNLDNAFVFDTVVERIRSMQGSRQMIFVTHNPNIPVLGDAARVFALRSTGTVSEVEKAGSVDEAAQQIMSILEGGRSAFEARRERYGRPMPVAGRKD